MPIAGRRAGLDGRQSSLFYEAIRIIKEMRCATDGKYAVKEISQAEIEGVGFRSASYDELAKKYDPEKLHYGYNTVDGEEIYYIPNPALGLWMNKEKL